MLKLMVQLMSSRLKTCQIVTMTLKPSVEMPWNISLKPKLLQAWKKFGTCSQGEYSGVLANNPLVLITPGESSSSNPNHFVQFPSEENMLVAVKSVHGQDTGQMVVGNIPNCSFVSLILRNTENKMTNTVNETFTVVNSDGRNTYISTENVILGLNVQVHGSVQENCQVAVPVQILMGTGTTDTQTYVLSLMVDDDMNNAHAQTPPEKNFVAEPQRTSAPEFVEAEMIPLNDTILAGNTQGEHGMNAVLPETKPVNVTSIEQSTEDISQKYVYNSSKSTDKYGEDKDKDVFKQNYSKEEDLSITEVHVKCVATEERNHTGDKNKEVITTCDMKKHPVSALKENHNEESISLESAVNENREKANYCNQWVLANKGNVRTCLSHTIIAQSEIMCNASSDVTSSSLVDVTSVSQNVPEYRGKKEQIKASMVLSTKRKTKEKGNNM